MSGLVLSFDPTPYVSEHGKEPRGRREWTFDWNGHQFNSAANSTLTEAKDALRGELLKAGEFGLHVVEVLP